MRLDQEAIKLCYSTHRQQKVVRNDITYDVQPYSVTSIANILTEGCRLVGIKRGVTLFMLKNSIAAHLPDQRCDLGHIQEYNSCSSQTNLGWKEQLVVHGRGKST